jgi:glucose/arabinose dehydrogenase
MTTRTWPSAATASIVAGLVLAACGGDSQPVTVASVVSTPPATTVPPTTTPATTSTTTSTTLAPTTLPPTTTTTLPAAPPDPSALAAVRLRTEEWFDLPLLTALVSHPTTGVVYLTSQSGEVWMVPPGGMPELALDLTGQVSPWVENSERGLLGIGISPADGRLFVSYTDGNIDSHVDSYALDANGRPDPASRWEVIFIDQPGLGHKGGGLAFELNGTMYLAMGDGGASSGRDAQDFSLLLGSVIRITPKVDGPGYDIPPDNPFLGRADARPELWAKGLRNPWGFCRDAATGDIWLSDVGNKTMEEVNRLPAGVGGQNFGWPAVEGTYIRQRNVPPDAVPPVFAYRHDEIGPAAIGGCVYRGAAIPGLAGAYLFSDITGRAFAVGAGDVTVPLADRLQGPVTGFGILPDGEFVVLTLYSGALRLLPA